MPVRLTAKIAIFCNTVIFTDRNNLVAGRNYVKAYPTGVNITLSDELRAKGRDLVYTLGKENFKTDVLGG